MRRLPERCAVLAGIVFGFLLAAGASAQYYFGQNKIQYNRFRWQVLKSDHFDIYFYPEMESLAEIGAHYAEECYLDLQDKFNFTVTRSIPLVFYSSHFHFEETNTFPYLVPPSLGGFFEFIKGRVVVPSDGSVPHFRRIIRHEMVHVFQQAFVERVHLNHRTGSGGLPLWFVEGLAEYWSEGWSSEAEMIIRDGVLNNTLVPAYRMAAIEGTFLMYKEGQSLVKFIADTYGEYTVVRLLENVWKAETFSEVLRITLGKTLRELDEEWQYRLKKTIYPLMDRTDFPRMVARRVTREGFNTLPAFYSGGGERWAVFVANRDGYSGIYRKRLSEDEKKPPEIVVRGERTPELESFRLQKSRISVDGSGRLAFVAKSGPQDVLYLYDLETEAVLASHKWPDLVSLFSPSWSPDGWHIALSGLDRSGKSDLYLVDTRSGSLRRLTNDFFDDTDPTWSPNGKFLAFASDRNARGLDSMHIFGYDLESDSIRCLTRGPFQDESPAWSRDGKTIAFISDRDSVPNVWFLEGTGDGRLPHSLRQATRFTGGVFSPCWTDSGGLLLSAFENLGFQIHEWHAPDPERLAAVSADTADFPEPPWVFPRIGGDFKREKAKYKKTFSLDIAQSQVIQDPIFGTAGGGEVVMSDMLGNEQIHFLLFNNARTSSEFWDGFNMSSTWLNLSRRLTYGIGLYRFAGLYYNRYEGYFYERRIGGFGTVSYPLNKFERLETSLNLRQSNKDRFGPGTYRSAFLVSFFWSYTRDNSLWGLTGPLDGERINLTLGQTTDIVRGAVNFTTVIVDVRKYVRLGLRMCWASRLWGQFNMGKDPLPFCMGGSWDLRGYRFMSLWNPKLAFVSNELRFPFIDRFYLGFPFGGIGLSSIRGALFLDAGNAWNGSLEGVKGSLGFGIRFQLGGVLVLRFDAGKRTDFRRMESRMFKQFFFGWDF